MPSPSVGAKSAAPTWTPRATALALGEIPLFAGLSTRHRQKVARLGTVKHFAPGTRIVTERARGDAAYVLLDGVCEIARGARRSGVELGAGAIIGEMALLDGAPRSATVVTRTEVNALHLGRAPFLALLRSEPNVAVSVIAALAARLREAEGGVAHRR
jgi:CRP-like cAMP-binding protein